VIEDINSTLLLEQRNSEFTDFETNLRPFLQLKVLYLGTENHPKRNDSNPDIQILVSTVYCVCFLSDNISSE
jgi:hypothetical protein